MFTTALARLTALSLLAAALPATAQLQQKAAPKARTPIEHLVVIFQENVSFDHYFATYPRALNPQGEPRFVAAPGTPTVDGLGEALLHHNPNAVQPYRLGPAQAATCDQDHDYLAEQKAFHLGLMDQFVEFTSSEDQLDGKLICRRGEVMAYFDGNTVTALWNYAQRFAMSDRFFNAQFGPSTPGALNLISGQTHGAQPAEMKDRVVGGTVIADPDPLLDDCAGGRHRITMTGRNLGDLLSARGLRWGWFQGGFAPTGRAGDKAVCGQSHPGSNGEPAADYVPHHEPFQYYPQTANPHHLAPEALATIGLDDRAHHQYDLADFWRAAAAGRLPAVSFLKAPAYQNGHAGNSDPLAEQRFLVATLNRLQRLPEWRSTAVLITYDDSDGWYDHAMPTIVHGSQSDADALSGPGVCGAPKPGEPPGRCGRGPRLPLLAISPWARRNVVDHAETDQTSILRFIEDNWDLGRIGGGSFDELAGPLDGLFDFEKLHPEPLELSPDTGQPVAR